MNKQISFERKRFVDLPTLDEVGINDALSVGEEAAGLGELLKLGASISPGFVVPISSYAEFVSSPQVKAILEGRPSPKTGELSLRLLGASYPKILERALRSCYRSMSGPRDTFVTLRAGGAKREALGEEELLYGIKKTWADHIAFLLFTGKNPTVSRLPILVQQAQAHDVAGKLFTSDPHSGDQKTVLVEVRYPDGEEKLFYEKLPLGSYRGGTSSFADNVAKNRLIKRVVTGALTEEAGPGLISSILPWAVKAEKVIGGPRELDWVARRDGLAGPPIFTGIKKLYLRKRIPVAAKVWARGADGLKGGFIPDEVVGVVVADAKGAVGLAKSDLRKPVLLEMDAVNEVAIAVVRRARHIDGLKNIHLVLPPARTVDGLREVKRIIAAEGLQRGPRLMFFMRMAFPANVVLLDRFLDLGIDGVIFDSGAIGRGLLGTENSVGMDDSLLWAVRRARKVCKDAEVDFLYQPDVLGDELLSTLLDIGVGHIVVDGGETEASLLALSDAEKRLLAAR